ncbi:MAG: alpha/beta hydrolase, partial [Sciscionella sp.]
VDVPEFVHTRFFTQPPGKHWAVAGLSEGGSCALMLTLRHPGVFTTFADYSGLAGPRVGNTNDPAGTVAKLFAGSRRTFLAHEPSWLLAHHRYPQLAGWFEVGSNDTNAVAAARTLAPLAQRAAITTRLVVVPGDGHTFALWRDALVDSLPWISEHIGSDTTLANTEHPRHP